jgi:hypothetical protein
LVRMHGLCARKSVSMRQGRSPIAVEADWSFRLESAATAGASLCRDQRVQARALNEGIVISH